MQQSPPNTSALSLCCHEEANSWMKLQAASAAQNDYKILIRTVDTEVVVMAVALTCTVGEDDEVWVSFGVGNAWQPIRWQGFWVQRKHRRCRCFMPSQGVTRFPALPDMAERQLGQFGNDFLNPDPDQPLHCTSSYGCRPFRGSSSSL